MAVDRPRGRLSPARRRVLDAALDQLMDCSPGTRESRLLAIQQRCPRVGFWLARLVAAMEAPDNPWQAPLERMAEGLSRQADESIPNLPAGARLGSWEVVRPVGSGGMGVVYRVARADGAFEMEAAAKLIRMRRDSDLELRLELERRLLARLDHPNIARILDGGTGEDGQPYLVMEWVPGEDLSVCAAELEAADRLQMFGDIAAAVAHAHQRSVVHGDIKPANVRLSADGRVRLLDFGIARLVLDEDDAEADSIRALTPSFAAPEQLEGQPASTQSDIWSLGALLAWLLLGDAYARDLLTNREQLSSALRTSIRRRRDLVAIIARACALEPEERYGSVGELLEDLQRHRELLPLRARAHRPAYLLDRFIRRNPVAVSLGSLSVLLLTAGLLGTAWQARLAGLERDRAEWQRDRAELQAAKTERVSEFVVGLFEQADPFQGAGPELSARDLLRQGRERIAALDEAPEVQGRMHQVLARVHRSLAEHETAHELSMRALALLQAREPADAAGLASAWTVHGGTLASLGRYEEAEQAHRRALELTAPDDSLAVAERLNNLGLAVFSLGRLGEAESLLETALGLRRAAIPDSAEKAASLNNLALVMAAQDRLTEAEPLYRQALALRESVLGSRHPATTYALTNLATLLVRLDRLDEAEAAYLRALALRRDILGNDHPAVASVLYQIGWLQSRRGDLLPARAHLEEALDIRHRVLGAEHPSTAVILNAVAVVVRDLGELDQAEGWLRQALAIYRAVYGESHHDIALVLANLGQVRLAAGDAEEAELLLGRALEMNRRELGPAHRHVADNLRGLAEAARARGDWEDVAEHARAAAEVMDGLDFPVDHPDRVAVAEVLADLPAQARSTP